MYTDSCQLLGQSLFQMICLIVLIILEDVLETPVLVHSDGFQVLPVPISLRGSPPAQGPTLWPHLKPLWDLLLLRAVVPVSKANGPDPGLAPLGEQQRSREGL